MHNLKGTSLHSLVTVTNTLLFLALSTKDTYRIRHNLQDFLKLKLTDRGSTEGHVNLLCPQLTLLDQGRGLSLQQILKGSQLDQS